MTYLLISAFALGARLLAAPASDPPSGAGLGRETLKPIKDAAEYLQFEQTPVCTAVATTGTPPPENYDAAVTYEQIAVMYGMIALMQPRMMGEAPETRATTIGDKLKVSVEARMSAYRCTPGEQGVHHLEAALALLNVWQVRLREVEKLPETSPSHERVREMIASIESMRPARSSKEPRPSLLPLRSAVKAGPVALRGYARFQDLISLRIEFGVGGGYLTHTDGGSKPGRFVGPSGRFSTSLRLLGELRRHALLLGGYYGWQHLSAGDFDVKYSSPEYMFVHGGGLQIEWSIRFKGGAVSIHPEVDFGAQAFFGGDTLGQLRFGGSFGLCIINEVVCVIPRGFFPPQRYGGEGVRGYQVNIGVDIFRAIDNRRRRQRPPRPAP